MTQLQTVDSGLMAIQMGLGKDSFVFHFSMGFPF